MDGGRLLRQLGEEEPGTLSGLNPQPQPGQALYWDPLERLVLLSSETTIM